MSREQAVTSRRGLQDTVHWTESACMRPGCSSTWCGRCVALHELETKHKHTVAYSENRLVRVGCCQLQRANSAALQSAADKKVDRQLTSKRDTEDVTQSYSYAHAAGSFAA